MNIKLIRKNIKKHIFLHLPKKIAHAHEFKRQHGFDGNLNYPETYDEKIHYLMIHNYDKNHGQYADKWLVREYVRSCGLEDLLIPLLGGPYYSADEIDFSAFPEKFALKANNGSGDSYYYLCRDRSELNEVAVRQKMRKALKSRYALNYIEYQYEGIKPAVICEKYLEDPLHDRVTDYKVVCNYGRPVAILVCSERNKGRDYFSTDWTYLDYTKEQYRCKGEIEQPEHLTEMLDAAERLSKTLPLARVDFYEIGGKLYFGEITLTPSAGCHKNLKDYGQLELGRQIILEK